MARKSANDKSNDNLIQTHYIFIVEVNSKLQALFNKNIAVSDSNLSNIVTLLIFRKNLISEACIYERTLSVITQDLRP